jgi:hypothetical protein
MLKLTDIAGPWILRERWDEIDKGRHTHPIGRPEHDMSRSSLIDIYWRLTFVAEEARDVARD